jgi:hypothetical protein
MRRGLSTSNDRTQFEWRVRTSFSASAPSAMPQAIEISPIARTMRGAS